MSVEWGCIFVCAVGLPGDKRPDKTAQAVQAALQIHDTCCQQFDSVSSISIGVATGRVKYQFEKSPLRECCNVYGEKVREATKLLMNNPGIVSCEEPTKLYSLLPLSTFKPPNWTREDVLVLEPGLSSALANIRTMLYEEQEVVKCASVIGHFNDNNFNFEQLKNTLPRMNEQKLIILLRSLFRLGILKCVSEPRNISSPKSCYCKNSCEGRMKQFLKCQQLRGNLIDGKWKEKTNQCQCSEFEEGGLGAHEFSGSESICSRNKVYTTEGNGNNRENFLGKVMSVLTEARYRTTAGSCWCTQLVETVLIPRLRH
ncbi:hypothetical protein AMELA_G00256220 [Ameiurus melas]|uniref:Uncharacterized protein n=1 Tax=Ameiurus melas TaxID=219545 RepID=A0A7J5ZS30_AMEME|nr:hypothetical protein AMELA_G00256220 [Ameiurus melas]